MGIWLACWVVVISAAGSALASGGLSLTSALTHNSSQDGGAHTQASATQPPSSKKKTEKGKKKPPPLDFADHPLKTIGSWAVYIWQFTLFRSGNQPVRVSQIVVALLILLIGILIARRIARLVDGRLSKVHRLDEHAAAVINKLLFYVLVVVVAMIAMQSAGIPITVFTVLGGALAIGVGFGAQNLFNNVISGLIIMTERPIRVGDIVQVGDAQGQVKSIGNRCTRVRRNDGIDLLIPNSQFLEQTVVNWTLFDKTVRGKVTVGAAYGSPTDLVKKHMLEALESCRGILPAPPPEVLFEAFGDSSLNFTVYFWAEIARPMDLKRLESEIRFKIDELFRAAEIVIAFPQRDVHLDSLSPVKVEMVPADRDVNANEPA